MALVFRRDDSFSPVVRPIAENSDRPKRRVQFARICLVNLHDPSGATFELFACKNAAARAGDPLPLRPGNDDRRSRRLIAPRDRNGNEKPRTYDAFGTFTVAESEQNAAHAALCQLRSPPWTRGDPLLRYASVKIDRKYLGLCRVRSFTRSTDKVDFSVRCQTPDAGLNAIRSYLCTVML